MKRALDVAVAAVLLAATSPILAAAALAVLLTSGTPVLHRARRVGRGGHEFVMYKLRTMRSGAGPGITAARDPRITSVGALLRRTRVDELPQLVNVLRGDMSMVGPRPEDPRFVALYTADQRAVLSVAPGLAGPAQLAYRREEDMLPAGDPEGAYVREILPVKLGIDLAYVRERTFWGDVAILARTAAAFAGVGRQGPGRKSAR